MIEKIEEYAFTEKKSYLIIFDVNSWFKINAPGINFPYTAYILFPVLLQSWLG